MTDADRYLDAIRRDLPCGYEGCGQPPKDAIHFEHSLGYFTRCGALVVIHRYIPPITIETEVEVEGVPI